MIEKLTKAERRRRAEAAFRDKIHYGRLDAVTRVVEFDAPKPWSTAVRERFREGWELLRSDEMIMDGIAERRGWFVNTVAEEVAAGRMSYPILPWYEPDDPKRKRGVAFRVDAPVLKCVVDGTYRRLENDLQPIGYHQVYELNGDRRWLYVPYQPAKASTAFQNILASEGERVIPLPYVIGNVAKPWLLVILEGQWDAISFHAAAGPDFEGAIFGMRGAQSVEAFMTFYGSWMCRLKPMVWVIPDNDRTGRGWTEAKQPEGERWPEPSLVDRLRATGAKRVVVSYVRESIGKDFNDFYRAKMPEADEIVAWMRSVGIED